MENVPHFRIEIVGENVIDPTDDNVDVLVFTEDGSRYSATFFTLKNIETLMNKWRKSGECGNGSYF